MRHLVAVLALSLSLAHPALADDPPPKDAAAQKDASGQTSDTNAPEGAQVKGYGYGTPSGTESNATAGQPTKKGKAGRKKKAPQQEADHDSAQPNVRAGEQGQHQGPLSTAPAAGKKHAKKGKKAGKKAPEPASNAPPPGEPTR